MIGVGVFVLFVFYGFPLVFVDVEKNDPRNAQENSAKCAARGDIQNALRFARVGESWDGLEPMAHTAYGRLLLESGQMDAGLASLNRALNLRMEPAPSYRTTNKPFYSAPARVTLGSYYLNQGLPREAVHHFELARAYATLDRPEYAAYRPALYEGYKRCGLWARALEFNEPTEPELHGLPGRELLRIARLCEGMGKWPIAEKCSRLLLEQDPACAEARLILGRADLLAGRIEDAILHLALMAGEYPEARFFGGMAYEAAGDLAGACRAYASAPEGSLYRPFALAKAVALLTQANIQRPPPCDRDSLLNQLNEEISRTRRIGAVKTCEEYRRFVPVSLDFDETYFAEGGFFPALIVWQDRRPAQDPQTSVPEVTVRQDGSAWLHWRDRVLHVEWLANRVFWSGVEALDGGAAAVPGWVDLAFEKYALRDTRASVVASEPGGKKYLQVTNDDINKYAMFEATPILVRHDRGYILAGALRAPKTPGRLEWQAADRKEETSFDGTVFDQVKTDSWTWGASYVYGRLPWETLRVRAGVTEHAGSACFADVMLLEVPVPAGKS